MVARCGLKFEHWANKANTDEDTVEVSEEFLLCETKTSQFLENLCT